MRNFTRMFLAVFAALATAGIVLFYIYVPFSGDTPQLDIVRERLARYLGTFGSLYLVLVATLATPAALFAAGTGVAAAGGRPARSVALKVIGLSLVLTIVGGLLGSLAWMGTFEAAKALKLKMPEAKEVEVQRPYTPKVLLRQRILGIVGGGKPVSGNRGVDPFILFVLTLVVASAVAVTRPGGPLRNLVADADEAMTGLFKNLTFWVAPTAVFLLIVAWLLTAWPKEFQWFYVLAGSFLLLVFIILGTTSVAVAASKGNVTPNYLLRSLRLPHVTAFGLGSPVLAIPQTMESCEECLAFTPLEKGIAVPLASVLARPGGAATIAFIAMGALQLNGAFEMWAYPVVGLVAAVFALTGVSMAGGVPVLALATASTIGWEDPALTGCVIALGFIGVLAIRVAASVDVTAATVIGAIIRRGSIPEDLDPDLHPGELIRMARQRRRRALRTRSERSGGRGGDNRRGGGNRSRRPRGGGGYRGDGDKRGDKRSDKRGDKRGGRRGPRRDNRSRDNKSDSRPRDSRSDGKKAETKPEPKADKPKVDKPKTEKPKAEKPKTNAE